MNEPDIAPLAKRLAEENNVDWHALEGTGEDGRIVERDVLDYLARVMAGEEDLDPTPEPVPEGMESWPEEQGRAPGAARATEPLASGAPPAGGSNGAPPDAGAGLLLDDEDAAGEDGLLIGDEPAVASPASPHGDEGARRPEAEDALRDQGREAPGDDVREEPAASLGPAAHEAGRDEPSGEPLPDLFSEGAQERVPRDEAELFDGELTWDEPQTAASAGPEQEVDAREDAFDFDGLPGYREQEPAPRAEDEPAALGGEPDAPPAGAAQDDLRPSLGEPAPVSDLERDAAAAGDEPASRAVARYRQILRRHVDLGAAAAAQRTLANELGREEPLPVDALLMLAARKAAGELELSGEVALARVSGDAVTLRSFDALDARAVLRAAREGDAGADVAAGAVALAVADLSPYGIDEAALDLDVPLLSLGRILTDSADGSTRGSVSLAGDLPVGRAASLLARVAELLEEPLRLLI